MAVFPFLFAAMLGVVPNGSQVSVAYAASLVRIMETSVAPALRRDTGIRFAGEARGSKAMTNLIGAGLRTPDVFVSADAALLEDLRRAKTPFVNGYTVFGSARMVLAYSPHSRFAARFAAAGKTHEPLLALLTSPGMRVGRTDPQVDPKGSRTLKTINLLGKHENAAALAQRLTAASQIFPEEDLVVRVETGELDAGFFYSTETPGRALDVVELPAGTNLAHDIAYAIAILSRAPDPQAAHSFVDYLLRGRGRALLEAAGVRYFDRPQIVGTP